MSDYELYHEEHARLPSLSWGTCKTANFIIINALWTTNFIIKSTLWTTSKHAGLSRWIVNLIRWTTLPSYTNTNKCWIGRLLDIRENGNSTLLSLLNECNLNCVSAWPSSNYKNILFLPNKNVPVYLNSSLGTLFIAMEFDGGVSVPFWVCNLQQVHK